MTLRYGCVGAGGIAKGKHIKGYKGIPGVELVAICDSQERLAKKWLKQRV